MKNQGELKENLIEKKAREYQARFKKIFGSIRLIVHLGWMGVSIYLLYSVLVENTCLVQYGMINPFMVYENGTEGYKH